MAFAQAYPRLFSKKVKVSAETLGLGAMSEAHRRPQRLFHSLTDAFFTRGMRPRFTIIATRMQEISLDRLELETWAEEYIQRSGRPAANFQMREP